MHSNLFVHSRSESAYRRIKSCFVLFLCPTISEAEGLLLVSWLFEGRGSSQS